MFYSHVRTHPRPVARPGHQLHHARADALGHRRLGSPRRPPTRGDPGRRHAGVLSERRRPDSDALSQATQQLSGLIEPDRLLGTKGLILGARTWGQDGDRPIEPMVGVRHRLDDTLSITGIAYGTRAHGADRGASYSATRLGGELIVDATLVPIASWLALHGQVTASATYLDAHGTYYVSSAGEGIDCEDTSRRVDGTVEGSYAAATAGWRWTSRDGRTALHSVRTSMLGVIGARPAIREGV